MPSETATSDIPAITSLNATNLMPGERYQLKSTSLATSSDKAGETTIGIIIWENIDLPTFLPVVVPEGSPKITVYFSLDQEFYYSSVDGTPAIENILYDPSTWNERDEIVVEIIEKLSEEKARNGDIVVSYGMNAVWHSPSSQSVYR